MGSADTEIVNTQVTVMADTNIANMMMNPEMLASIDKLAERMASAKQTMPAHIKGSVGDCWAIIMQSIQWKMNPFVVAQKTHLVSGRLGYEAQLVNAVVMSMGATKDRPNYEWFGDWNKVLGKFKEIESKKKTDEDTGKPLKYRVPDWTLADEQGLGVRVWATMKGETVPRELTLLLAQCRVRNSPLWADDPRQQIAYLGLKRWTRLHCPDVLMGVYTPDELAEIEEREVGPGPQASQPGGRSDEKEKPELPTCPDEKFSPSNLEELRKKIESGKQTADSIIFFLCKRYTLTDEQKKKIKDLTPIEVAATTVDEQQATDSAPAAQTTAADPTGTEYADPSIQEFFES